MPSFSAGTPPAPPGPSAFRSPHLDRIASLPMRIPADAIIAEEKLTRYLLVPRPSDDKSGYLARGGFTLANPDVLRAAIMAVSRGAAAIPDGASEYGEFWRVEGLLGNTLPVVVIWMRRAIDGRFHFVTLKPPPKPLGTGVRP